MVSFKISPIGPALIPRYNDLGSGLNKLNILKEQVLLRVFEEQQITLDKLKEFFKRTYFWYNVSQRKNNQKIPIEQLLMIKEIAPSNVLKLHSDPRKVEKLKTQPNKIRIIKCTDSTLSGYVKTTFGVYTSQFDINTGIQCSCGFKNGISDNFSGSSDTEFAFEFCDHTSSFLMFLISYNNPNVQRYVNDIIPKSIKNQYVLNYLFEKGLIMKNSEGKIYCSNFGKLIIRLYLYPTSGVLIRYKLEHSRISSFQELIREGYNILRSEFRVRDNKMLDPILEWIDEVPIDQILKEYQIMTGDLFSVRDSLERIITFIGIIARELSINGIDLYDYLSKIAEMTETLKTRIKFGVREELFDLVKRLDNVARVRARILYDAGYHVASQVMKERPYVLNRKTGLGINLCKKIIGKK
ncbi:MAG: hypothetical protein ACW991_10115 [Candidatus Hodarchaeales archaeon]|jgi:hypothetical protein